MINDTDLVEEFGGEIIASVDKPDYSTFYLIKTDNPAPYYEEDDPDCWGPEILLVAGSATSWCIDCSFEANRAKIKETLEYLINPNHFMKYDKWDIMRMFDHDGGWKSLPNAIMRRLKA